MFVFNNTMKPNDANAKLPPDQRPFRILTIAGTNRQQYNRPGVDGKARTLMLRTVERLPQDRETDYEILNKDVTLKPKKGEGEKLREN